MYSNPETYQEFQTNLAELGDLPIFSASVNRISTISENPDADAMQLSMEVMKDANLSIKLLRLANSVHYNRGQTKMASVSQAVMVLGFDTIKNISLSLKLLDSLSRNSQDVDMSGMLVHAYLSASFMRELAYKTGVDKIEQSYICGLLHNMGEMMVAYAMPNQYLSVIDKVNDRGVKWQTAQQEVLSCSFDDIARDVVTGWGFAPAVINTIGDDSSKKTVVRQVKNSAEFNTQVTRQISDIMGSLYLKPTRSKKTFTDMLTELQETTGLDNDTVRGAMNKAFEMGCDLANEFNLSKKLLAPRLMESGDAARDRIAKQFAYHAQSLGGGSGSVDEREVKMIQGDPAKLLDTISEMTVLMTQRADINKIFMKLMDGLCYGAGFQRVALCLLTPKRDSYAARLVVGKNGNQLKSFIQFKVDREKDLFSKLIFADKQLHIPDVTDPKWYKFLPKNFAEGAGADNFVVSAFGDRKKPLGMFYADMGNAHNPVSKAQFESFKQLVNHARLALQMR